MYDPLSGRTASLGGIGTPRRQSVGFSGPVDNPAGVIAGQIPPPKLTNPAAYFASYSQPAQAPQSWSDQRFNEQVTQQRQYQANNAAKANYGDANNIAARIVALTKAQKVAHNPDAVGNTINNLKDRVQSLNATAGMNSMAGDDAGEDVATIQSHMAGVPDRYEKGNVAAQLLAAANFNRAGTIANDAAANALPSSGAQAAANVTKTLAEASATEQGGGMAKTLQAQNQQLQTRLAQLQRQHDTVVAQLAKVQGKAPDPLFSDKQAEIQSRTYKNTMLGRAATQPTKGGGGKISKEEQDAAEFGTAPPAGQQASAPAGGGRPLPRSAAARYLQQYGDKERAKAAAARDGYDPMNIID